MQRLIVTYFGSINDIQDREDLTLAIDFLEVTFILDYLGYPASDDENPIEFSGLFVLVRDGDYEEVYSFKGCVPYLYKNLCEIANQ